MGDFKFDVPEAVAGMERNILVDYTQHQVTLFAVMCIGGDGESSHGGQVVSVVDGRLTETACRRSIDETVANAVDMNLEAEEGHPCMYVPVAIGLPVELVQAVAYQLEGREPSAEKEWRMDADGLE